ncbi:MAG: sulfotransferase family 2 domain-containing protein [Thermodesulfobacteriota bacterium]
MLISYNHRFLFVHIAKAAGSSIEEGLAQFRPPLTGNKIRKRLVLLGSLNRIGGLYRHAEFGQHATLAGARSVLPPEVFESLYKFAFVRNPWDRMVSRYHFLQKNTKHHRHQMIQEMNNFDDYLDWELKRNGMHQFGMVTDGEGRLLTDFIGYFERLEEDFAQICSHLSLDARLPHRNKTRHSDYRTYYSDKGREKVAQFFKKDIELFGYTFDGIVT